MRSIPCAATINAVTSDSPLGLVLDVELIKSLLGVTMTACFHLRNGTTILEICALPD